MLNSHHANAHLHMKRPRHRSSSLPRTEDLSRLLDPSYLPHSSSSTSSSPSSVHAWVDDHGDLHDPDYRDFPLLAVATTASGARRPHWEGPGSSSDDDDDNRMAAVAVSRPVSPRERRRARYDAEYALYASAAPSYASAAHHSNSTSHAHVHEYTADAPAPSPPSPRRRKLRPLSPRRSLDSARDVVVNDVEEVENQMWLDDAEPTAEPKQDDGYAPERHQHDLTPSRSEQLRRQWHAFTLGVRFSLFRAQRRIHRRLSAT